MHEENVYAKEVQDCNSFIIYILEPVTVIRGNLNNWFISWIPFNVWCHCKPCVLAGGGNIKEVLWRNL
jgi:hypothetical protein